MSDIFNNELFEAFASASDNVYIYVCDMKTDISRWSGAAVDYFGLEGEYIKDAANVWAAQVHPDDLEIDTEDIKGCLLYTSPRPRDVEENRMPSSA